MKIGNYEIHAIDTGSFRLDGGAMFGVIPKTLWNRKNPADEQNRIEMAMRCLLLVSDKKKILVDTGIGRKFPEKETNIYHIEHTQDTLDKSLKKLGFTKNDITDVFITHLHFDHAGGNTRLENGKPAPAFPNALYHVDRYHYEWACFPTKRDSASFLPENFEVLKDTGQLQLHNGASSLFPGTSIVKVHGHTPHQSLLKVESKETTLLYCADLIPTSSHISLPWIMGYDLHAAQTLGEKEILLEEAYRGKWILFFEHDPKNCACTVKKNEKQDYEPFEWIKI
jgi:glyoxylase-like metal-dependent hydrolase (beta-lactamase superfamily II)